MVRVIIICEGETEREFCNKILSPYFIKRDIYLQAPLIKKSRGGIINWESLKKDISNYLKGENVYVTTLIDYYGIQSKHHFPQWDDAENEPDKNIRMQILEQRMKNDIDDSVRFHFLPYIQLHEFESLLFIDIKLFYQNFTKKDLIGIAELQSIFDKYSNPEMINDGNETSPSHRLGRIISGYEKIVYGNILAEAIGLERIRLKCPMFNNWINNIENLNF